MSLKQSLPKKSGCDDNNEEDEDEEKSAMISMMTRKLKIKLALALAFERLRQEECLKFNTTGNYRAGCHVTTASG